MRDIFHIVIHSPAKKHSSVNSNILILSVTFVSRMEVSHVSYRNGKTLCMENK